MRNKLLAASVGALVAPAAFGGAITTTADITLSGGMTAGYFYSTNTGSSNEDPNNGSGGDENKYSDDEYQVSDFMVELSADAANGVGFVGAFGTMAAITVLDGGVGNTPYANDFQYGWLTVAPVEGVTIEAGKLATNVGYEVTPSYANPHATIAALWGGQPVYYPGVRLNYETSGMGFYVEANDDTLGTADTAWAAGVSGGAAALDYSLSFYSYNGYKQLVDVIVSTEVAGVPVAANFDYHKLEDAPSAGADDTAWGVALYVTPAIGSIEIPVRVEFLDDGSSGVYGVDSATTFTVTPTYRYTENGFVRAELSYVSSDVAIFHDEDGVAEDTKTSFAVQAGFTF